MKAVVYHGPGDKRLVDVPKPKIEEPTDAIVKITMTTICGTDLHILKGDLPEVKPGTILGHEAVGIVEEVGTHVKSVKPGDRVLISCITGCGYCSYCRKQMYSHCSRGGWILGHLINGTQAEYVRVPYADFNLYKIPDGLKDEDVIFVTDILPTAYECGVLNAEVKPGDVVAIIGAGPIGQSATMLSKLYSPSKIIVIDKYNKFRVEMALKHGADVGIVSSEEDPVKKVMDLTDGEGADAVIEAVGVPESFELCTQLVKAGGRIGVVGVFGKPATLHLEKLWCHNITIRTKLVDTYTIPTLLKLVESGRLNPRTLLTHRFKLDEAMKAYDIFSNAAKYNALKVALIP